MDEGSGSGQFNQQEWISVYLSPGQHVAHVLLGLWSIIVAFPVSLWSNLYCAREETPHPTQLHQCPHHHHQHNYLCVKVIKRGQTLRMFVCLAVTQMGCLSFLLQLVKPMQRRGRPCWIFNARGGIRLFNLHWHKDNTSNASPEENRASFTLCLGLSVSQTRCRQCRKSASERNLFKWRAIGKDKDVLLVYTWQLNITLLLILLF